MASRAPGLIGIDGNRLQITQKDKLIFDGRPVFADGSMAPPFKPQIVATRCGGFNAIRQGTAGGRSDVMVQNRQKYYIGNQPVSQLRVAQAGFYLQNDSTGEELIGNDFTWEHAVEIDSPSMFMQGFTNGTKTVTVAGADGITLVQGDPFGYNFNAGDSFWLRQAVTVADTSKFIPGSSQFAGNSDTGWISPLVTSQVPGTGDMTLPVGGAGFGGPQAIILGIPLAPMASVLIVGDSIPDGTVDAVDTRGNYGFIARGLASVNGYSVPYIRQTNGGDQLAQNTINHSPRKRCFWPFVTHLAICLGTNDIFSNNASLSTLQGYVNGLMTEAKRTIGPYGLPLQTALFSIMPRTNSTDSWATAAGQTAQNNMQNGGARDQFNAWGPTIVGKGLLDSWVDTNTYVEDPTYPGRWITNNSANYPTSDGTHPNSALHILAANAVNRWAQTITPLGL